MENMRYSASIGFLVVLLKLCISEGGSDPIPSTTEGTFQDGQTLTQEPALSAAEMMPVVSPPSLKEVQQAVQEASKQVYGHGAEEVLKELLERVVEAALSQAERGAEAKDVEAQKEVVYKDSLGVKTEEHKPKTEAKILEQPEEARNMSLKEDVGFEEREGEAEADAFEDVAVREKGVVKGEGETAAGSIEKSTEAVETRVREEEGLEATDESLETKFSPVEKERVSKEKEENLETKKEDSKKPVVLSVIKNSTETEIQDKEETAASIEAAIDAQPEQETVDESKPGLTVADDEQQGNNWGKEEALKEETQHDKMDGEKIKLPSKEYEIKISKHVTGEPGEVEEEVKNREQAKSDENGRLAAGGTEKMVEFKGSVDERNGKGGIKEESATSVNERSDKNVQKEEDQIVLESLHQNNDPETPVIPGLQPEDSTAVFLEKRLKNQPPTPNPSAGEVEIEENTLVDENSHHSNILITPTHDFLPHNYGTLDHFDNDVLAEYHQAEGEPEETKELVENVPGIRETNEQGLKKWKIGAIFAAVFLVIETVVIIIYIVKCQNKKSAPAAHQACEEGCVEQQAATGGDCSDDTRPKGNTQQYVHTD